MDHEKASTLEDYLKHQSGYNRIKSDIIDKLFPPRGTSKDLIFVVCVDPDDSYTVSTANELAQRLQADCPTSSVVLFPNLFWAVLLTALLSFRMPNRTILRAYIVGHHREVRGPADFALSRFIMIPLWMILDSFSLYPLTWVVCRGTEIVRSMPQLSVPRAHCTCDNNVFRLVVHEQRWRQYTSAGPTFRTFDITVHEGENRHMTWQWLLGF
mmetsp:Transcript_13599/g.29807  ORF Transcript_13599/g.29807 Transcript_13599/m.29807 type:complete len:212 (+) Transcript_13599:234-869(+)